MYVFVFTSLQVYNWLYMNAQYNTKKLHSWIWLKSSCFNLYTLFYVIHSKACACHLILAQEVTSPSSTSPSLGSSQLLVSLPPLVVEYMRALGGQPGVAFGDGEWSPGAAGITCAGRSVAAGFLQSVRSELWSCVFKDTILLTHYLYRVHFRFSSEF